MSEQFGWKWFMFWEKVKGKDKLLMLMSNIFISMMN